MNALLPDNPYKVLGVERTASEAEIKQAYFALVRQHSPERDPEGFKRIRAAYEKIRAGGERATTDLFLLDDQAAFDAAKLQAYAAPPPLTPELICADALALETFLLLEEACAAAVRDYCAENLNTVVER
jgi:curved DNA-binding protein CbpA